MFGQIDLRDAAAWWCSCRRPLRDRSAGSCRHPAQSPRIVSHNAIGQPIGRTGHRQIENICFALWRYRHDAIPEQVGSGPGLELLAAQQFERSSATCCGLERSGNDWTHHRSATQLRHLPGRHTFAAHQGAHRANISCGSVSTLVLRAGPCRHDARPAIQSPLLVGPNPPTSAANRSCASMPLTSTV